MRGAGACFGHLIRLGHPVFELSARIPPVRVAQVREVRHHILQAQRVLVLFKHPMPGLLTLLSTLGNMVFNRVTPGVRNMTLMEAPASS